MFRTNLEQPGTTVRISILEKTGAGEKLFLQFFLPILIYFLKYFETIENKPRTIYNNRQNLDFQKRGLTSHFWNSFFAISFNI